VSAGRVSHPTLEEIALWVIEPESDQLRASSRTHLESGCPKCNALAASLRELQDQLAPALGSRVPEDFLSRAEKLIVDRPGVPRIPVLLEELPVTGEALAVRDAAAGMRTALFRGGGFDVHVQILPKESGHGVHVLGQVLGPKGSFGSNLTVRTRRGGRSLGETSTDEWGEFALSARDPLPFSLEVEGGAVDLRTPVIGA
jgi:hypothetical protein